MSCSGYLVSIKCFHLKIHLFQRPSVLSNWVLNFWTCVDSTVVIICWLHWLPHCAQTGSLLTSVIYPLWLTVLRELLCRLTTVWYQLRYAEQRRCNSLNSCRKVYGWPCGGHIRDSLTKEATSNGTAVPCPITALRRKVPDRRGVELTVLLFQYSFCSFSQQEG